MPDQKALFDIIRFILLLISIIWIWYLIRDWRRKKAFKQRLPGILSQVRQAKNDFDSLTCFQRYFANADEQSFIKAYSQTREIIVPDYSNMGLAADIVVDLQSFCNHFDFCASKRKDYNNEFVRLEQEKYAEFFAGLEAYPLSPDQTEAIIRDEDNNLVIAGAGLIF